MDILKIFNDLLGNQDRFMVIKHNGKIFPVFSAHGNTCEVLIGDKVITIANGAVGFIISEVDSSEKLVEDLVLAILKSYNYYHAFDLLVKHGLINGLKKQ